MRDLNKKKNSIRISSYSSIKDKRFRNGVNLRKISSFVVIFVVLQLFTSLFLGNNQKATASSANIDVGVSLPDSGTGYTSQGFRDAMDQFEVQQGRKLNVVDIYVSWTWYADFASIESRLDDIYSNGSTPEITWSPANITANGAYSHDQLINGSTNYILDRNGDPTTTTIDQYIAGIGSGLRAWQQSHNNTEVRIRLMAELNGSWSAWGTTTSVYPGNTETTYQNAYKHIVDVFEGDGVPGIDTSKNIKWVYNINSTSSSGGSFTGAYPGNNYVDINSIDGYNWGDNKPTGWQTFPEVMDSAYNALAPLGKPIEISEWACASSVQKASWITDAFNHIKNGDYPLISSLVWFNSDHTGTPGESNWKIDSDSGSLAAYSAGVNSLNPFAVTGASVSNVTSTSARITWSTNRDSDSTVKDSQNNTMQTSASLVQSHSITLNSLTPNHSYSVKVVSTDEYSNADESSILTFETDPIAVAGINVSPATLSLVAGGATGTLTATVSPSNATNKTVTWQSNHTNIATVSGGIVTPVATGSAIITATTQDGNFVDSASITVTPTPVAVTGVTISPSTLNLVVGGHAGTLTASVSPTNATNKTVSWSSDYTNIATVSNGVVTPVGIGSATITATTQDGSFTDTASVTVGHDLTAPNTTFSDPDTDVVIGFNDNLPSGASSVDLVITKSIDKDHDLPTNKSLVAVYDITARNQAGSAITTFGPDSAAHITLPDNNAKSDDVVLYWDGSKWSSAGITNVSPDLVNGKISFDTIHFSEFAVVQTSAVTGNDNGSHGPTTLPVTGPGAFQFAINFLLAFILFVLFDKRFSF